MMLANDKLSDFEKSSNRVEAELPAEYQIDREAKRIACIAESMNIIRTLNSHKIAFNVYFGHTNISFDVPNDTDAKAFHLISMEEKRHCLRTKITRFLLSWQK